MSRLFERDPFGIHVEPKVTKFVQSLPLIQHICGNLVDLVKLNEVELHDILTFFGALDTVHFIISYLIALSRGFRLLCTPRRGG